ncbi:MAG: LPS export ABC transporter periplasmic protein LptC [Melioribacteraceae bacterium]|nr:LPS export ABC transporter periplasmic protein LptC [Melioribacteraceae bacterium]MCF8355105.1 LPS export ABC transporter periplasmic protein LptC [Melioribacteraceae bacterium]MCF8392418.1 LPS export ABC transporter periplasmic protein LptC [Melioribacteraceae bacterium]MCF8417939.1 LPS export ABC transporter periplasmic protein LptC [Melioribacteraceae bacterium]
MTYLIFLIIVLITSLSFAQEERLTVVGDSLRGRIVEGENVREVIGNVVITQGGVRITCNKARQFISKNEVELIGNVIATQDTVIITTEEGYYFGNEKYTFSDTGVVLDDGHINLSAKTGYYYFDEDRANFKENVILVDSLNVLHSDELTYYQNENKAVSVGHVQISDTSSTIYADSLIHFRSQSETYAFGTIKIENPNNNVVIIGEELVDLAKQNYTKIIGDPLLLQIDTTETGRVDTLIISALMLESIEDSTSRLIATDSVEIVRGDFYSTGSQSIYYRGSDKIVTFRKENEKVPPVMWYEETQVFGDTIKIYLKDNELDWVDIKIDGFISTAKEGYEFRYDQISGYNVKLFFKLSELKKTEVMGNVLSIYFMFDEDEPNGLIKSSSASANIYFDSSRVIDVRLYGTPMTEYHPENLVKGEEKDFFLPGFYIYENKPSKPALLRRYLEHILKLKTK